MNSFEPFHCHTPIWRWREVLIVAAVLLMGSPFVVGNESDEGSVPVPKRAPFGEWPQFGGSSHRNNASDATRTPTNWTVDTGAGIRWSARLGSSTNNSPTIAGGKVFIGSNNGGGYLEHVPPERDMATLLCFDEKTGGFLWQYTSPRLETGRVNDWPMFGLFSQPLVDGTRLWFTNNRCELVCLDTEGFRDRENDGPEQGEPNTGPREADVVWKFDMFKRWGVRPHNVTSCSVTCAGDVLLVNTSNGVDQTHANIPAPDAPSFAAFDRHTGKVLWSDNSPASNILHGQWSSPAYGVFNGVPQAIFAGGDGWLYSFDLRDMKKGKSNLLWRFDCNPKESKWSLGADGRRNNIIGIPVIHEGYVFIGVGQDPEHGEGDGYLWCIDPSRRGDISSQTVFNRREPRIPIPHKRIQACEPDKGDFVLANPNSGVVWHYDKYDRNKDGKFDFDEAMHRTVGSVVVANNLLVVADAAGIVHCMDAKTGHVHWAYDLFAATYLTPLIADGKIYVCDEDGDVAVFRLSKKRQLLAENVMDSSIGGTPVAANSTLYITTRERLFAIADDEPSNTVTPERPTTENQR